MAKKVLVLGGSGFIGRHLCKTFEPGQAIATYRQHPFPGGSVFDADTDSLATLMTRSQSEISHVVLLQGVIDPEICAKEPERTRQINLDANIRLISEAFQLGIFPVFISSDYVFDGKQGFYADLSPPCPNTEYGRQKAEIENWLQRQNRPFLIARLSKVVSSDLEKSGVFFPLAQAFLKGDTPSLATDQIFSPIDVRDVSRILKDFCEKRLTGLINVAGDKVYSRYALGDLLRSRLQPHFPDRKFEIMPCLIEDVSFVEKRPQNTSLDTEKLKQLWVRPLTNMEDICDALVENLIQNQGKA